MTSTIAGRDGRDGRVDSATGVLVILVVFGHVLLTMEGAAAAAARFWVYTFHVPAFVFLSGYVTRYSRAWSAPKIITRLMFPYIVFALIQRVLEAWLNDRPFELKPTNIPWTLWYLLALMVWRLTVPLVRRLPMGWALAVSVGVSIVGAALPWVGSAYSLGRILGFFPFFVVGLLWRDEWWQWALSRWARAIATVGIVLSVPWALWFRGIIGREEFVFARRPDQLGLAPGNAMLHRAVVLVIAATLALCVISLAMRNIAILARIGVATLTVYLLHAVVLFPWHLDGAPAWLTGIRGVALAFALSAVLAWILASPPVVAATRPLMDIRWWETKFGRAPARPAP